MNTGQGYKGGAILDVTKPPKESSCIYAKYPPEVAKECKEFDKKKDEQIKATYGEAYLIDLQKREGRYPVTYNDLTKETHTTGANKETDGKLRMDLIPAEVDKAYAEVLTFGALKYADRNWEKGLLLIKHHLGAMKRHISKWELGIDNDHESNLNHLKHALFHIAAMVTMVERGRKDLDDRVKP
jgi:hypothetical protein